MTLFSWCSEVVAAALGMDRMIGSVNLVTAALSSSLLAALAIAEKMRVEHNEKLEAQTELVHTYEAMPIGLFTLDSGGNFLSTNPALDRMLGRDVARPEHNKWEQFFKDGAWQLGRGSWFKTWSSTAAEILKLKADTLTTKQGGPNGFW
jgi:PAS domain-containing protein